VDIKLKPQDDDKCKTNVIREIRRIGLPIAPLDTRLTFGRPQILHEEGARNHQHVAEQGP
jgi:hypothetical protein